MRHSISLACALLTTLALPGCGGRTLPTSGGNGKVDGKVLTPDAGPTNLCVQVTGTCQAACPASAPAYKFPPVSNACGAGKMCCVANCVSPPGTCSADSQCKGGKVCSTSLGVCGADPCCPQCSACYGKCVKQTFFATVTGASAGADLMPPSTGAANGKATLVLRNTAAKPLTGITLKGGIIGFSMGAMLYSMTYTADPPFSGKLAAKGEVTVKLKATGKLVGGSAAAPCNKQVYMRVDVGFAPSKTLRVKSPEFKFGCVH